MDETLGEISALLTRAETEVPEVSLLSARPLGFEASDGDVDSFQVCA